MNTDEQSLFTSRELQEVESFLRESYFRIAETLPAARPRDPEKAVGGELEQLRKAPRRKQANQITEDDLKALESAATSVYASEFSARKERVLRRLAEESGVATFPGKISLARLFLRIASRRLCTERKPAGATRFAISSASLAVLMGKLGLDPLFAPAVVWFATQCRDVGVPVLCDFIKEYLKQSGVA